ncbi:MAG: tetratricopeptide repeat protein [Candidatus Omnitrophica bacterium]|nr:tetratricopeptide repeat protein [Candidatus Omnitrophota bacterium]MDD5352856.1 tetratricopeptide repeat protein [Candidatus Omnitrophota bacterium]MDD5550455.1 tetratricopeptide repeat protein [Candidatus Omnitrophota bacterium]
MDDILKIRLDLDEAITYADFDMAKQLAHLGLSFSKDKGALGEVEYFKGQLEIIDENYPKAIEHFDMAIKYNPHDGASYNDRALCMVETGIIDEALKYFDAGIKAEPDFATIHHNKGWLLNKIGRHSEAIDCFRKALELDNNRAVTYENLADAYLQTGDDRSALDALYKAVAVLKPQYAEIKEELVSKINNIRKI